MILNKNNMTIIFIFSGNARSSPFNIDKTKRSDAILKSYNDFLFTPEFKSKYDYKIYITADNIHLEDTIRYLTTEKIGNIHLTDTNYYYKPITKKIPEVGVFLKKYNEKDFGNHQKYENSIHQHYKIHDCYNLFRNDGIVPTYIVRMRMDIILRKNILEFLDLFESNQDLQISCNWDFMAVGKPNIMKCYCTGLENNYGNYTLTTPVKENPPIMINYHSLNIPRWKYSPEIQLFEMLFEYCINNNIDLHKSINADYYFAEIIR
jgi:hypothetical protein